jgi:hypothetical protein
LGFEPTISVIERAKTVHALDRVATVNGNVSTGGGDLTQCHFVHHKPYMILQDIHGRPATNRLCGYAGYYWQVMHITERIKEKLLIMEYMY